MLERLQKVLARHGISSRRKAEELIQQGQVTVNAKLVQVLGTKVDAAKDIICVNGKQIEKAPARLFLFNKPRGVISTLSDPQRRKSLESFVRKLKIRVFPVGRLDIDVSGLLLMTNDGEFAHKLLHPSFGQQRKYLALVSTKPSAEQCRKLCRGVELKDGKGKALSASEVKKSAQAKSLFGEALQEGILFELVVAEGRKHFVKQLIAGVGLKLIALSRVSFGEYQLGTLKAGEFREIPFKS